MWFLHSLVPLTFWRSRLLSFSPVAALLFLSPPPFSLSLPLSPAEFRYHTNRTLNQVLYRKGVVISAISAWLKTDTLSGK